jgi:hypothetical protein
MVKKCQCFELLNHNTTVWLAHIVKLMLARNYFQQVHEPQYPKILINATFFLIPTPRTLRDVKRFKMSYNQQ